MAADRPRATINDVTDEGGVQDRPWWTSGSRWALAFLVASNVALLLTVFVPAFSEWQDRHLQDAIAESDRTQQRQLGTLNRQVEITRLLFDHFFGRPANEQHAVVSFLSVQFPHDLRQDSLNAILIVAAKDRSVARQIKKSVALIEKQKRPLTQSKVDRAPTQERRGFVALIDGRLADARAAFLAAYKAYPVYHNVDEISHTVLTDRKIADYNAASAARRQTILKDTIDVILTTYSWGIPPDLLRRLKAAQ